MIKASKYMINQRKRGTAYKPCSVVILKETINFADYKYNKKHNRKFMIQY